MIALLSVIFVVASGQECTFMDNTNGKGTHILYTDGLQDSVEDCCNLCSSNLGCNAFVYCPEMDGCENRGNGEILDYQYCALKYFYGVGTGEGYEFWYADNETDFSSGYILGKQAPTSEDGYCSLRDPIILCEEGDFCDANKCVPIPDSCGDLGENCCPFLFGGNTNSSFCFDDLVCQATGEIAQSECVEDQKK